MDTQTVYTMMTDKGLMAGMRGNFPPDVALGVTDALMAEGINVFEFTTNSTDAIGAMQAVKKAYGNDAASGMGTVLDVEMARRVLDAGADFVVSPAFSAPVVKMVMGADKLIAPGVITPTECVDAWSLGVKLLKLFPIGPLGEAYFKAIRGPLSHMNFLANGGINAETTKMFIAAGAVAVGASSWLTGDGTWSSDKIRERARLLVQAVAEGRGEPRRVSV